jgi:hypothetical protein
MKTCFDCPAYRLENNNAVGYCPINHRQVRKGYIMVPEGYCPKPNQAELIEILEQMKRDEISEAGKGYQGTA